MSAQPDRSVTDCAIARIVLKYCITGNKERKSPSLQNTYRKCGYSPKCLLLVNRHLKDGSKANLRLYIGVGLRLTNIGLSKIDCCSHVLENILYENKVLHFREDVCNTSCGAGTCSDKRCL